MSEEFPGISKDTYLKSRGEVQDGLTYDMLTRIHNNVDGRLTVLEKRKNRDTVLTGTMALVGGAIAFLIQTATFKKLG